jgi:hypothetical protein
VAQQGMLVLGHDLIARLCGDGVEQTGDANSRHDGSGRDRQNSQAPHIAPAVGYFGLDPFV